MLNKLTTWLSGMALLCISLSLFSQEKKEIKLENYFGDLSARQIGPAVMSGRISDMENHPTRDCYINSTDFDIHHHISSSLGNS